MYTAYREFYIHGHEGDPTDLTVKEYETLDQAIAYVQRYAHGIRFCSAWVETTYGGNVIYEIVDGGGRVFDYRKEA